VQISELEQLVKDEIVQRKEKSYDVEEIEKRFLKTMKKAISELNEFMRALEGSALKPDFCCREPSVLEKIRAERSKKPEKVV